MTSPRATSHPPSCDVAVPASRPKETTHEHPVPRPVDPRDPRLPRGERLVLRQGDPPRGGPRVARGVPDQHAGGVHRQPAAAAARPAGALLLARPARRVRGAAQRGHLAGPRRRARRPGAAAGGRPRHPARQDPLGQGPEGPLQHRLRVRRRAGRHRGGPARRTPGEPPGPGRPGVRLGQGARGLHPARRAHGVRPLDAGDHRRGRLPRHPLDPAQPALAGAARPGRPPEADPRDDDVGHQRHRRRRGLRQGPHHPAARCRRPPGAQAGVRAHRRPGRHRGGADRLPGRRQAARRQPRPGRLPGPQGRRRRPRGVPDRQGPVPSRRRDRGVLHHRPRLPLPDHRRPARRGGRAGARTRDR